MAEDTAGFLKQLFAPYGGGAGMVEVRCLRKEEYGRSESPPRRWFPLTAAGLQSAAGKAGQWARDWNVYYGVLPRRRAGGGGAEHCGAAGWLWCDIDHAPEWEAARRLIDRARLPTPHLAVGSGNGVHAYWRLACPVCLPDEEARRGFRCLLLRLCGAIGGAEDAAHADRASTDAARILRLPGTLNWKEIAAPKPVRLVFARDSADGLTAREWDGLLPCEPLKAPKSEAVRHATRDTRTPRYITHHCLLSEVSPVGSRHRNCTRLLMAMRGRGAGTEEMAAAGRAFCDLNAFPMEEMAEILRWAIRR